MPLTILNDLPDSKDKKLVLLSGGIDSAILLRVFVEKYGSDNLLSVYQNFNHTASFVESKAAKDIAKTLNVNHIELKFHGFDKMLMGRTKWVDPTVKYDGSYFKTFGAPGRGLLQYTLAATCASINDISTIAVAINKGDESRGRGIPMTGTKYLNKYNELLSMAIIAFERKIQLISPFANITKIEEAKLLKKLDGNYDLLYSTVSCWFIDQDGTSCGECFQCFARKVLFSELGISDNIKTKNNN